MPNAHWGATVHETAVDRTTGRKYHLDYPDPSTNRDELTFLLSLHGGGSVGAWQRDYFPAHTYVDEYGLVVATPSAATKEPTSRWVAEADDDHLRNVVNEVFERFGSERIRAFWLVGHSQGGLTSNRLLRTEFFANRVDGWLSLSGGRIGRTEMSSDFRPPPLPGQRPRSPEQMRAAMGAVRSGPPDCDFSFIYATGEHEIVSLPETSPWAEKYGAGERVQLPDVVDTEAGLVYDGRRDGSSTRGWGFRPRPGTAQVYVYPGARDGRVIADVVRLDKGHTEGLEPKITEQLVKLIVSAPGGKARHVVGTAHAH